MKKTFARNWRFLIVIVIFSSLFLILGFRAFQLQILPEKRVERIAEGQFLTTLKIKGRRANILDLRGKNLAVSDTAYSIFVDPSLVKSPRSLSKKLAKILAVPSGPLLQKLSNQSKRFVWVARRQNLALKQAIEALNERSVGVLKEYKRRYPLDTIASHILGFTSSDGRGLEGVERFYDRFLRTKDEYVKIKRDARGRPLFEKAPNLSSGVNWKALRLNIDADLQYYSEKVLAAAIEKSEALGGVVIIMDPHDGAIRTMVGLPTYNSNHYQKYSPSIRRNRVLTDPIEPGSVVKVFTVAEALERGVVKPDSIIRVPGKVVKIGKKTIRDSHEENEKEFWSVRELMRLSSNVAIIRLAQKLGYEHMADRFDSLGFSSKTGIDLPGESRGLFRRPKKSQELEWATISFGQGIAVTPLQIVTAFASLANGGKVVVPKIAHSAVLDGETLWEDQDAKGPWKQIYSESTLKAMTEMLVEITESGTAPWAQVPGFKVAGKTGTSQKVDYVSGGYKRGAYLASFAGFLPAMNPRYVAYVMIDEPQKGSYYGGPVAGAVFSKIMSYAMRLPDFNKSLIERPVLTKAPSKQRNL